jgi:hypothetical protein
MAAEADRFDAWRLKRQKGKTNLTYTGLLMEGLGTGRGCTLATVSIPRPPLAQFQGVARV